jgi:putative acetyltransferase
MPRRATAEDAPAIARLFRLVRQTCLPYLPELHTPAQDLAFFRDRVLADREVWCTGSDWIEGFTAFGGGWIDHLYVHPDRHGRGLGTGLLNLAQRVSPSLQLWAFQRNTDAIGFYLARGFRMVEQTNGDRNEEHEPDARFEWQRQPADRRPDKKRPG